MFYLVFTSSKNDVPNFVVRTRTQANQLLQSFRTVMRQGGAYITNSHFSDFGNFKNFHPKCLDAFHYSDIAMGDGCARIVARDGGHREMRAAVGTPEL